MWQLNIRGDAWGSTQVTCLPRFLPSISSQASTSTAGLAGQSYCSVGGSAGVAESPQGSPWRDHPAGQQTGAGKGHWSRWWQQAGQGCCQCPAEGSWAAGEPADPSPPSLNKWQVLGCAGASAAMEPVQRWLSRGGCPLEEEQHHAWLLPWAQRHLHTNCRLTLGDGADLVMGCSSGGQGLGRAGWRRDKDGSKHLPGGPLQSL